MNMHNYTKALKISTLAIVLSFGLSYVYAWTAPTATPPNGNVSAPINTSTTAQAKSGTFSASDLGINNNFIDTNMTIPETPAGGDGAIVANGWPNFSDVAANAVKLAGLTSADILSAQTGGGGTSGVQPSMMTFWSGSATCPTGWTKAFSGKIAHMFYQGDFPFAVGVTDTHPAILTANAYSSHNIYITCVASGYEGQTNVIGVHGSTNTCTVCAR